jgi:nephrocystin-3
LTSKTTDDLYERILERCEKDYEDDRPRLVRDALSLIWAARKGLSESELMDLLGNNNKPIPKAYWSPFQIAIEASLSLQNGLIGFSHDYFRKAVKERYVRTKKLQNARHLQLVRYFGDTKINSARRIQELPWHLAKAGRWKQLYKLLSNISFFDAAWKINKSDVLTLWAMIQEHSKLHITNAYRYIMRNPEKYAEYLPNLCEILEEFGYWKQPIKLYKFLINYFKNSGNVARSIEMMNKLAIAITGVAEDKVTMHVLRETEKLSRKLRLGNALADCLASQALIYQTNGKLEYSIKLHKKAQRIYRRLNDKAGLAASINDHAIILHNKGQLKKAIKNYQLSEQIYKDEGDMDGIQEALGNIAYVKSDLGNLNEALKIFKNINIVYKVYVFKLIWTECILN